MGARWQIDDRDETPGGAAKGWSPRRRYEQRGRAWAAWQERWAALYSPQGWELVRGWVRLRLADGAGYRTIARETGLSQHMVASLKRQFADDPSAWGEPEPSWAVVLQRLRELLRRLEEES